jgi:predicted phage terminase large subunit-like protein
LQYVHVPGYAAIVFRRTLTDLKQPGALLDRAHSWLRGKPGCRFAGDEHTYYFDTRWPDGTPGHPAKVAFGYIGEANIQTRYQSAEYQCVEKGTQVLMGDGRYKCIEDIVVGDLVMTLSGPKSVTRTFDPMVKECVKVGNQIQGITHKLLKPDGTWSTCEPSVPIERCVFDKSELLNSWTKKTQPTSLDNHIYHQDRISLPVQLLQESQQYGDLPFESKDQENAYEVSCDQPQDISLLQEWSYSVTPQLPVFCLTSWCDFQSVQDEGLCDVHYDLLAANFLDCCLSYCGQYDAQFLRIVDTDQVSVPLQVYAEAPNHLHQLLDATWRSQVCTPDYSFWYSHPYNFSNLRSSTVVPLVQTFIPEKVGERVVYDITVEDENHFITQSGFVNRNCILWDELTQHEEENYLYLFSRLRKKACPVHKPKDGKVTYKDDCLYCKVYGSLPLRVRGATNPGGVGHQWVRDRFGIVPSTNISLYDVKEDDTDINWIGTDPERPFIQASYRDNPHIDQEAYSKALDNLSSIERARLKYGNWAVNVDARFKPRWARHYSTRGDRYFTLGRDGHGPVVDMSHGIQRIFTTVDPAASKREGMAEAAGGKHAVSSWTVIATWALTNDFHLMLLDVVRFQDEIPVVVKELVAVNKRWRPAYFRIEGNGLGKGVVQYAQIYGLTVKEGKRYTDKVVNSTAAQLRMEQGRIWFPQQAPWLKTWEDEIFNWTGDDSQTDDQVDVLADAAQDVVWEAGDDREDRDDHLPSSNDYPMCFGYNEINSYF